MKRSVALFALIAALLLAAGSAVAQEQATILAGAELAGVAGIFLAIPVVAILTVSYRHWLEHRGSEGLADLLEPPPAAVVATNDLPRNRDRLAGHPDVDTTPEEMARERPDLTTGELKMPVED